MRVPGDSGDKRTEGKASRRGPEHPQCHACRDALSFVGWRRAGRAIPARACAAIPLLLLGRLAIIGGSGVFRAFVLALALSLRRRGLARDERNG
jgi:hypothetical protein